MKYTEVKFYCSGGEDWHKDVLIDDLGQIGFDTFEDHDEGFSGFIASDGFDEGQLQWIIAQLPVDFQIRYDVRDIKQENWNALWESNFNPIQIGDDCYVRATFHEPKAQFMYEIVIDPKMSFGTGHHQTTSMMLEYILEVNPKGMQILDMGCGTGILAILALKRGAVSAVAIDFDSICVESVIENAVLNAVSGQIEARLGSKEAIRDDVFDVIYANINRNILLDQITAYHQALKSGGDLYISGFFKDVDLEILKTEAESMGFEYIDCKTKDQWAAARFLKRL
jgi:ribosomal protein L11 methyltransferase